MEITAENVKNVLFEAAEGKLDLGGFNLNCNVDERLSFVEFRAIYDIMKKFGIEKEFEKQSRLFKYFKYEEKIDILWEHDKKIND